MFGLFDSPEKKAQKATQFVAEMMLMTVGHLRMGPLADELFKNLIKSPYHAGYIQGKISGLLAHLVHSGKVSAENANMVSGMTLIMLFEEDKARKISSAINAHASRNEAGYQQGYERGSKVALYSVGARDVEQEPEVERAKRQAKSAEQEFNQLFPEESGGASSDPTMHALMGLEIIWFTETLSSVE